jgi:acid phosphatase type 7
MQPCKKILYSSLFLLVFIAGCARAEAPTLIPTIALSSSTPIPATASPSASPMPLSTSTPLPTDTPAPTPTPTPAVLIGAGDIAFCGNDPGHTGDEKTGALIENLISQSPNAVVFTAGDTVYGDGTMTELKQCFEPSWGKFKDRIRPSPGNHDYTTASGQPYYTYFGAAAGEAGVGYYSYNLGDWHIISLNSNCNEVGCGPDSEQVKWLRQDLQSSASTCTLMYWHHPRWSSGIGGGTSAVSTFWKTAAELGVDVVVNGHDHDYERFAPMDGSGNADANGVRLFVVGTGGAVLRDWGTVKPNSEVRYSFTYGAIQFKLSPGRYDWQFFPTDDASMTDTGSGVCH